jgi:hypothetical protein
MDHSRNIHQRSALNLGSIQYSSPRLDLVRQGRHLPPPGVFEVCWLRRAIEPACTAVLIGFIDVFQKPTVMLRKYHDAGLHNVLLTFGQTGETVPRLGRTPGFPVTLAEFAVRG